MTTEFTRLNVRTTWWDRNSEWIGAALWTIALAIACSLFWIAVDAAEAIFR